MKRQIEPSSTSYLPPTKFPRRPGSEDLGRDYEMKITALLSLRCAALKSTKDMWIGSNVDRVGDFDDIVLYRQNDNDAFEAYMIQLKHQDNPKNITPHEFVYSAKTSEGKRKKWKEDFSLPKYSTGFLQLQDALKSPKEDDCEIIKQLAMAQKIVFIIFTNKGVNSCDFLFKSGNNAGLEFLNTRVGEENIFQFDQNRLNYDRNFLNQLYLFTNQVHVNESDNLVKKEIKQMIGSSSLDFNSITKKFITFIKNWSKGTGVGSDKVYVTLRKADIIDKLTDITLEQYTFNMSKNLLTHHNYDDRYVIWNAIIFNKSVIVVDEDDFAVTFLTDYIESEIRKYYNKFEMWNGELSSKTESLLFAEHEDLELQKFKATERNNLTAIDIYKCAWFAKKIPLLLELRGKEDARNIRKVLKMSKYTLKVIIINKLHEVNLSNIPRRFVTLKDLNKEEKSLILNKACKIQGRPSLVLKEFVDKSMHEYIKCRDIVRAISNDFSIGNEYEPLLQNFIPRHLSKVVFKQSSFKHINDSIILIHNASRKDFEIEENKEYDFGIVNKNKATVTFSDERANVGTEELKADKNVHELRFCGNGYYEWIKSSGSLRTIQQHQLVDPQNFSNYLSLSENSVKLIQDFDDFWEDVDNLLNVDSLKTTRIINADPGMGKTILLDYVAVHAPSNLWALKVNLNEHHAYYERLKGNGSKSSSFDHLIYFNEKILEKHEPDNVKLARAVFEKFLKKNDVLLLMDGFDEISISYKNEVTNILKCRHKDDHSSIWITTRSVTKLHLEEQFNVMSNTLRPFSVGDQKKFLTTHFTRFSNVADRDVVEEFVAKLLEAARTNLTDRDGHFTGIPLQTKLLADVFKHKFETCLSVGIVEINDKFDLLYLYEEFLKEKNNILCEKFGVGVKDMRIFFEKHQQLFALKALFGKNELGDIDVDRQLEEYYENRDGKVQFLQREGVVVVHHQNGSRSPEKFNVNFVHRTFAEYLAAKWLAENFDKCDERIRHDVRYLLKEKFYQRYEFLYHVFDRMIASACPLHLAVINQQVDKAKKILISQPESLNELDRGGRSVLHLMGLYGVRHPKLERFLNSQGNITDVMVELLDDIILDEKIVNVQDKIFEYGPLDYALLNRSLAVANKMCQKSSNVEIRISSTKRSTFFSYCALLEYKYLFKTLVPYFAYKDLLAKDIDECTLIKDYCVLDVPAISADNICKYAFNFGINTISELFQNDPGHYRDLCLAASYGTKDNLLAILSDGADVNKEDVDYNTALHYAAIHNNLDNLKILLSTKEIEVDIPGGCGNTALHCAVEKGNNDILKELLLNNADINRQNNEDDTPLSIALMYNNLEAALLLLDEGAYVAVQNDEGNTCLHIIATEGHCDIISKLLLKVEDMNVQNSFGQTALHYGISGALNDQSRFDDRLTIINTLLDNDADCNKQDILGCTPLHLVSGDCTKSLRYLLEQELNSNAPTENLEESIAGMRAVIIDLKEFCKNVVRLLLQKNAKTDITDDRGKTPLDRALESDERNEDIIDLLRSAAEDKQDVSSLKHKIFGKQSCS